MRLWSKNKTSFGIAFEHLWTTSSQSSQSHSISTISIVIDFSAQSSFPATGGGTGTPGGALHGRTRLAGQEGAIPGQVGQTWRWDLKTIPGRGVRDRAIWWSTSKPTPIQDASWARTLGASTTDRTFISHSWVLTPGSAPLKRKLLENSSGPNNPWTLCFGVQTMSD